MTEQSEAANPLTSELEQLCRPGKESDVIALLLEEYRTLRAEIVSRHSDRAQLLAFSAAATGLIASGRPPVVASIIVGVVAVCGLGYWLSSNHGIQYVASHVAELETKINQLAAHAYGVSEDGPLGWENAQARGPRRTSRRRYL